MKAIIILLAVIGLINAKEWNQPASRGGKINTELVSIKASSFSFSLGSPKSMIKTNNFGLELCPICIQFADDALNFLIDAVLNVGVVGSCQVLCTYVADKTGSQTIGTVCNLLCDFAGIDEFIKVLDRADLDPIWYCELLRFCAIFDQGDATITSFTVTPNKGPQGVFVIDADWFSLNGTGTGELYIGIKTVDGIPVEDGFLMEPQKPGKYNTQIKLNAVPDKHCDPTQQECENWLPGFYKVEMAICNGECGSKHPHSKIYTEAVSNFTITK